MIKNKKYLQILSIFIFIFTSFFTIVSLAISNENNSSNTSSYVSTSSSSSRSIAGRGINKCFEVENTFASKAEKIDLNHQSHLNKYKAIYDRLLSFKEAAVKKGANTIKLESYLKSLKSRIDQFESSYQSYFESKNETKTNTCQRTEDDFRNSLETTRRKLSNVDQDSKNIIGYIKNTILPELRILSNN